METGDPQRQIVDGFHHLYYEAARAGGTWASTYWMGVKTLKCPLDLWIYQEILCEVRPELIIECGTADGGSTLFLAQICDLLGRGEVVSIDVRTSPRRRRHPRISYWIGSSTDACIVAAARRRAAGRSPVLVILDSNHAAGHVLQELRLYGPLVTPGSYLIVEDTNVNGHPVCAVHGPGPMEAVRAYVAEEPSFQIDREREKFLLTFNPSGYLRKCSPLPERASLEPGVKNREGGVAAAWDVGRAACGMDETGSLSVRAGAIVSHLVRSRLRALALAAMDRLSERSSRAQRER